MGDAKSGRFRLAFNPQLGVEFRGATVTSDAGLLIPRELDERLGLNALIKQHLTDPRTGRNRQFPLEPDRETKKRGLMVRFLSKVLSGLGIALVVASGVLATIASSARNAESAGESGGIERAKEVARNAAWGRNVSIRFEAEAMIFESDGIPNHSVPQYPNPRHPNALRPQNYRFAIPLSPRRATTPTPTNMGPIGVAVSGAVFFNPYEAHGQLAIGSGLFIDDCNGHTGPRADYHYHGVPRCITDALDIEGRHSRLIGYLFDGFPVYGPRGIDGRPPTDLDGCNGHFGPTPEFPEGHYHYHTTETAPYVMSCYSGEIKLSPARMGPPGLRGGPPRR